MAKREGWRVTDDVYLGTFAYSKMPMWKDLERMRVEGVDHPLVRQLAGEEAAPSPSGPVSEIDLDENRLKGGGLDDLLKVRDQYAVLPADFSQLRAIEKARGGEHLVIHGPPGTGKSQTIANIMATLLADGKRVLFVSEKTAALDVVKRRLEECDLDIFCLDLHSERGKKSSVYQQLRDSLEKPRSVDTRQFPFESLESKREYLNQVVRALHSVREPLGRTIFQIHGRFAELLGELPNIPPVEFIVPKTDELDQESLAAIIEPCDRIARRGDEFEAHATSRWLSLIERQPSIQLADAIRTDMATVRQAVAAIRGDVASVSEWINLPPPESGELATHLADLIEHLRKGEGIPNHWLDPDTLPRLRGMARLQREQQKLRLELIERLSEAFGENLPAVDYGALSSAVRLSQADQAALRDFLSAAWTTLVVSPTAQLVRNAEAVVGSTQDLLRGFAALADERCQITLETWKDLWFAMGNADRIAQLAPVPVKWTEDLVQVKREMETARNQLADLETAENSLHERFSDKVVEVVDGEMLVRYRADYQSFWKRLGRRFREDQRLLRGHLNVPGKLTVTTAIEGIELALDVRRLRAEWADKAATLTLFFSSRFDGRHTDWQAIERDIQQVELLIQVWPAEREVLATLLTDADVSGRLLRAVETAEAS
ncbi:MAG: AAA domain-containing protein, partial [Pseudomonadales bacterium]